MVAHVNSDSLEKFLFYVNTEYIRGFQNFYVRGTRGHHIASKVRHYCCFLYVTDYKSITIRKYDVL